MARFVTGDRVKESTTTTGTGVVSLAGAASAFIAFSAIPNIADGDEVPYAIVGGAEWEVGIGVWNTGNLLTRSKVLASSNSGALVSFSAGSKDVWCDFPAQLAVLPVVSSFVTMDSRISRSLATYVCGDYEILTGCELEIELDAVLVIG